MHVFHFIYSHYKKMLHTILYFLLIKIFGLERVGLKNDKFCRVSSSSLRSLPGSLPLSPLYYSPSIASSLVLTLFTSSLVQFMSFNLQISQKVKTYSHESRWFTNHTYINAFFTDHEKIESQFPEDEKI